MNAVFGWLMAAVLAVASYQAYGWQGLAVAVSVIVFWLLLQFNRAVRVMRNAGQSPVGEVPSAVMFNARLEKGMTMLQVVSRTRSLGRKVEGSDDDWVWRDAGGSRVTLRFQRGRLQGWQLERPAAEPEGAPLEQDGPGEAPKQAT